MSHPRELDEPLDLMVEALTRQHPGWIRVVQWVGRLHENGGPGDADVRPNRVLVWDGAEVRAEYGKNLGLSSAFRTLAEVTQDVDWTQVRAVTDRDGQGSVVLVTDEPRRSADDAATDPYWRQVHDYLELNRAEVEELVEGLRASGDLPGEERSAEGTAAGRRLLGYFREDR